MRAMVIAAPGGLDKFHRKDIADPGQPGAGQIRVRIHASSLNYHDYAVVMGRLQLKGERIPMSDAGGVVEAVGEGVTQFQAGDHVVSLFHPGWQSGPPMLRGSSQVPGDGIDGYACDAVVVPENWFTLAPRGYSHEEAATLTTAGLTAWRALTVNGRLRAGDTVLVLGTGGVSIFALQIAKAMGARVMVTSSSDAKLERAKSLGADYCVNYKQNPKWGDMAFDWTGGRGIDQVIEVGGPGTLAQSIAAVAPGGHISLIGVLTGVTGDVPTGLLMRKQARLQGISVGHRLDQMDFVRALDATGLRPVIDRSFALEDIAAAFAYEESGAHFGKICLSY